MMRALFVTVDGGGNLPPALGIAAEVARRGGEARFLGHAAQRTRIEAAGFRFQPYRRGREYDPAAPRGTLQAIRGLSALVADRGIGADTVEAAAAEPTDVVVVDTLLYRALADAVDAGLPAVQLMHTLHGFLVSAARGPLGMAAGLRGVRAGRAVAAPRLTLVTSRRELDETDPPDSVRHTGIVWQGRPVPAVPRPSPRILVSLSTTSFPGQLQTIQKAIDALSGLDAEVIVTTGPAVDPARLRPASNTTVHRYVDHGELLPETSVVVGHGGHSTAARALSYGIPVLVIPSHPLMDQPVVGRAIAAQGAGLLRGPSASPDELRSAVSTLLTDGRIRDAAARLGASIRERDGAVVAADLLESFS